MLKPQVIALIIFTSFDLEAQDYYRSQYLGLRFPKSWLNFVIAVNKAFQFSSITSVTLLDCWTIVWVIILTWFILGTRYSLWQFLGAAVCVAGLVLVLLSDAGVGGGGDISCPSNFTFS